MELNIIKFRSSIRPSLLHSVLFQGSLLAFFGMLLLLGTGAFLSQESLKHWGLLIFFMSIGLIAIGMLPYRRLTRLEINPHEIVLEKDHLHFFMKKKCLISIPLKNIEKMSFIELGRVYGIGIWLKNFSLENAITRETSFNIFKFHKNSQKKYQCDLFLAYFSKRTFAELQSRLNDIVELD